MIDLKPFCGADNRTYLHAPFIVDGATFATNGHIIVRIPVAIPGAQSGDNKVVEGVRRLSRQMDGDFQFIKAAHFRLPARAETPKVECDECDGTGHQHDCPSCKCVCEECGGSGLVEGDAPSVGLLGKIWNHDYLAMVFALPSVEIAAADDWLAFRFDGGVGLLMKRRVEAAQHAEAVDAGGAQEVAQ